MSDQTWALIIGFLTVAGFRIIDWYLPKGWHSHWAERHGKKEDDDDDKE